MPRRVFFSFHYERDVFRTSVVRNSDLTKDWEKGTPVDHASWEALKRTGKQAVYRWIDNQLSGAGVTCVLVGAQTSTREFCMYEIQKSHELRKGIVAVRIHGIKDARTQQADYAGQNPLDLITFQEREPLWGTVRTRRLSEIYRTYDYIADNGYANLKRWIEEAATNAGR